MRRKYKRSTKICMAGFRTCLVKCPLQYTVLFLFGHQKSATLPPFFDTTLLKFQIFQSLLILGLTQPWNCCMYSSDIAQGFAARALWIFAVFSPFLKFHNEIKALAKLHINFYFIFTIAIFYKVFLAGMSEVVFGKKVLSLRWEFLYLSISFMM